MACVTNIKTPPNDVATSLPGQSEESFGWQIPLPCLSHQRGGATLAGERGFSPLLDKKRGEVAMPAYLIHGGSCG